MQVSQSVRKDSVCPLAPPAALRRLRRPPTASCCPPAVVGSRFFQLGPAPPPRGSASLHSHLTRGSAPAVSAAARSRRVCRSPCETAGGSGAAGEPASQPSVWCSYTRDLVLVLALGSCVRLGSGEAVGGALAQRVHALVEIAQLHVGHSQRSPRAVRARWAPTRTPCGRWTCTVRADAP